MEKTLVIVPSGQATVNIDEKDTEDNGITAKDAFSGSAFKIACRYADSFADKWIILNPIKGFITPESLLRLEDLKTHRELKASKTSQSNDFLISTNELRNQLIKLDLFMYDKVIGLGGKKYRTYIEKAFTGYRVRLFFPFSGLKSGEYMRALKEAISEGQSWVQ